MRVTSVQSVVRAGDKDLAPLKQTSREKAGDHADEDFLKKCGVHRLGIEQTECHPVTRIPTAAFS